MFYTNVKQYGNKFLVRGVDDGGNRFSVTHDKYRPTLFVPSENVSKFQNLRGDYLDPIQPGTIRDCRDFIDSYKNVSGYEIYGFERFLYQYIGNEYEGQIDWDIDKINVVNIDIECESESGFPDIDKANEAINAITIKFNDHYVTYGCMVYDPLRDGNELPDEIRDNVTYVHCDDEEDLLRTFLYKWVELEVDVVTGWNINFFDIPYLVNRMSHVLDESITKNLSPHRIIHEKEVTVKGQTNTCYELAGITVLDYLDLYRRFEMTNQESYRLDHIAHVELGKKKLDYSEHGSLHLLYKQDFQKFIDYNINDVYLVDRLDQKLGLLALTFTMAYDAKVLYEDVYSQVRMWDAIIYNHLREKHLVMPLRKDGLKSAQYAGGYVKEPQVGMHNWVVSFDLNSLYPHLIMQYNISPETLRGGDNNELCVEGFIQKAINNEDAVKSNYAVAANGSFFDRSKQGFLPELMQKMYNDRVVYKKKMIDAKKRKEKGEDTDSEIARYHNLQYARKIQLNSAYGALGNQYFRFYDVQIAQAITCSGQLSIRWVAKALNNFINTKITHTDDVDFVIAADTDSVYLSMEKILEAQNMSDKPKGVIVDYLDALSSKVIFPFIEKSYDELATYMNAYEQKMRMGREVIADKGVWTAKKRYALNVWDNEGIRYKEPELKIMGIETTRSSTPELCREDLKRAIKLILTTNEDAVIDYIDNFRERFMKAKPEDIAFPRGCNDLIKYKSVDSIYTKGTPIAVRGALVYNHHLKKHKLTRNYEMIKNRDKVKFLYLRLPNPVRENVISFPEILPPELDIHSYVDYDKQFEKTFLDPLKNILNVVGWNTERSNTLERYFV
jgi:DNA polymerase elongation subunit (family B)